MTTAPIPEQWKPLGRTYNTRYFLAADDVMIVLSENDLADWSFARGEAQYVLNPPPGTQAAKASH